MFFGIPYVETNPQCCILREISRDGSIGRQHEETLEGNASEVSCQHSVLSPRELFQWPNMTFKARTYMSLPNSQPACTVVGGMNQHLLFVKLMESAEYVWTKQCQTGCMQPLLLHQSS